MIGEWSHISAVGFSVDCFNIVEFYVPSWKGESVFSLEAENNDYTVHNHNQTLIIISTLSDPICPPPPPHFIILYSTL